MEYGHQRVRQYKLYWTKDSLNGIKEQRNFRYIPDKDGRLTDKTMHIYSHLADARRYAIMGKVEPLQAQPQRVMYDAMKLVDLDF